MTTTRYYNVARHVMALTAEDDIFALLDNCRPFEVVPSEPLISIVIRDKAPLPDVWTEEWRQEEEGDEIACGHVDGYPLFVFRSRGKMAGWLKCDSDYHSATLTLGELPKLAIDNAMMIVYALATAEMNTLLFHASVVCREGKAYMFLGPSGTGMSTHTRLWLRYIEGSRLLNDDNPVVRIENDGRAEVYGSPWSGKTPCYVNEHYPLGSIVRLKQAPYNAIRPMSPVEAYATMASSVSGKRWEKSIADGLHRALNSLTATTRLWQMECLPDEAAAKMTSGTI